MMRFKEWLEAQQLFPFMTQEDPPNLKKIRRFPDKESYVKSQSRYGTQTGQAAESIVSAPPGTMWAPEGEEVIEIVPNALIIPSFEHPGPSKIIRPERGLAFVHLQTKGPLNTTNPQYQKKRYRILAYWQGPSGQFDKNKIFDGFTKPLGGLMGMGGYILDVWTSKEFRGSKSNVPNLHKAIMNFARERGIHGIMPEDATCPNCGGKVPVVGDRKKCPNCGHYARPLASNDFKAAQAKHDWNRTQSMLKPNDQN